MYRWCLPHLQVTLATLVTDGAVKRVVDQQKLHHTLSGLAGHLTVSLDAPALHHWHGTGSNRLCVDRTMQFT